MKISSLGLDLIKAYETLALKAYLCQACKWTNGWGHTKGVKLGDTCTIAQATTWLDEDCDVAENAINTMVKSPLSQRQFDALCALVFNIGVTAFGTSTILRMLNDRNYAGAAEQFPRWNKVRVDGKLIVSNGLVARRADEKALFLSQGE